MNTDTLNKRFLLYAVLLAVVGAAIFGTEAVQGTATGRTLLVAVLIYVSMCALGLGMGYARMLLKIRQHDRSDPLER